jgi:hypothetical protein
VDCKKFLMIFSMATHVCAAITYLFLPFFQPADGGDNDWAGIAMLVSVRRLAKSHELWLNFLKGGSFLYVGPALQPVREDETRMELRLERLVWRVFIPPILSAVLWARFPA